MTLTAITTLSTENRPNTTGASHRLRSHCFRYRSSSEVHRPVSTSSGTTPVRMVFCMSVTASAPPARRRRTPMMTPNTTVIAMA